MFAEIYYNLKYMISIIVPVYNVSNYLSRCIDSILAQSYTDFEIILVDDGSTDDSPQICDTYVLKDNRINVIHQKNQGPSTARNEGTKKAIGEYITYIDSDDFIHPEYLNILFTLVKQNNAELACCSNIFYYDNDVIQYDSNETDQWCFSGIEATENMLYGKYRSTSACGLLIEKNLAKKFLFPVGKYHEDDFNTFNYFLDSTKVVFTTKKLYYYYQRNGSIMHRPYSEIAIDELNAADYIFNKCSKFNFSLKKAAAFKIYNNYMDIYNKYPNIKSLDKKNFLRIKKQFYRISLIMILNEKISKKTRLIFVILLLCGFSTYIYFYNKWIKQ